MLDSLTLVTPMTYTDTQIDRPGNRVGSGRFGSTRIWSDPNLANSNPTWTKFGLILIRPEFGTTRICQIWIRSEFPYTTKIHGENAGPLVFDPNLTRITILIWPIHIRPKINSGYLGRLFFDLNPNLPDPYPKFGSGSSSGSGCQVSLILPDLQVDGLCFPTNLGFPKIKTTEKFPSTSADKPNEDFSESNVCFSSSNIRNNNN